MYGVPSPSCTSQKLLEENWRIVDSAQARLPIFARNRVVQRRCSPIAPVIDRNRIVLSNKLKETKMKPLLLLTALFIICNQHLTAQDHVAVPHFHDDGICWGYAMGRALGKKSGDAVCDPKTIVPDPPYDRGIDPTYFSFHSLENFPNLQGLREGDIVEFAQGHAAYVVHVPSEYINIEPAMLTPTGIWKKGLANSNDEIRFDHFTSRRGFEQTWKSLSYLRSTYLSEIGYWRAKNQTKKTVIFKNSFDPGDGINGGDIYLGKDINGYWNSQPSGIPLTVMPGFSLEVMAHDEQEVLGVIRKWDKWQRKIGETAVDLGEPISFTLVVSVDATYTAVFREQYRIWFKNQGPGGDIGGIMIVSDETCSSISPESRVLKLNSITATAVSPQTIDEVTYTFANWQPGWSTSTSTTFSPSGNTIYVANFTAKPTSPSGVTQIAGVGENVHLIWNEHPNVSVSQYQIWRRIQPRIGNPQTPVLIGTVNRGTNSFIDNEIVITSYFSDKNVSYDVRSVYSAGGTTSYSDENWAASAFGTEWYRINSENEELFAQTRTIQRPTRFDVGCYPNPFNPSTTISYQLLEEASVQLEIYDMMGKRIAVLVNDNKAAGYYSVIWSGKNESGSGVASGMYLYRFTATPVSGQKPFSRSGKLLMMK
jgi:hypothetical protein